MVAKERNILRVVFRQNVRCANPNPQYFGIHKHITCPRSALFSWITTLAINHVVTE